MPLARLVTEHSRPPTPLEVAVATLWSTALRRKPIGLDENFFMLGGDSLRGARLVAQVNAAFGVDISVEALFEESGTVAGMARHIERERGAG